MIRTRLVVAGIAVAGVAGVSALVLSGRPMLVAFTDPGELQRPSIPVFNPLRNKDPERVAEELLRRVSRGDVSALSRVDRTAIDLSVYEKERTWPLRDWKLVNRTDTSGEATLLYRTLRDPSTKFDSQLVIRLQFRDGQWRVVNFTPVY